MRRADELASVEGRPDWTECALPERLGVGLGGRRGFFFVVGYGAGLAGYLGADGGGFSFGGVVGVADGAAGAGGAGGLLDDVGEFVCEQAAAGRGGRVESAWGEENVGTGSECFGLYGPVQRCCGAVGVDPYR